MLRFTDHDKLIARELLLACHLSRDRLPYTEEFEVLHRDFAERTGRQIDRSTFWRLLSGAAKVGGLAKNTRRHKIHQPHR